MACKVRAHTAMAYVDMVSCCQSYTFKTCMAARTVQVCPAVHACMTRLNQQLAGMSHRSTTARRLLLQRRPHQSWRLRRWAVRRAGGHTDGHARTRKYEQVREVKEFWHCGIRCSCTHDGPGWADQEWGRTGDQTSESIYSYGPYTYGPYTYGLHSYGRIVGLGG